MLRILLQDWVLRIWALNLRLLCNCDPRLLDVHQLNVLQLLLPIVLPVTFRPKLRSLRKPDGWVLNMQLQLGLPLMQPGMALKRRRNLLTMHNALSGLLHLQQQ